MAPLVLLVNRDLPVNSTTELVDLMKRQPGSLSCASGGPGTSQHLACEMFKLATQIFAVHIPYKGNSYAMTDLMKASDSNSSQVQSMQHVDIP